MPGTQAHAECTGWPTEALYSCPEALDVQSFSITVREESLLLRNIMAALHPAGEPQLAHPGRTSDLGSCLRSRDR